MFFELRQYRMQPGKEIEWVNFMEETIIPYQVSKGMVVVGSFISPEEEDLYVWIRRFASEDERQRLYAAVYETDEWRDEISPRVAELIDRTQTHVTLLEATPKSVIQ